MPKIAKTLSIKEIDAKKKGTNFSVGGVKGLTCNYHSDRPCYYLRWMKNGIKYAKYYPVGLPLSEVRKVATEDRLLIDKGLDPFFEQKKAQEAQKAEIERKKQEEADARLTFEYVATEWLKDANENDLFKYNRQGDKQTRMRLNKHILPVLGEKPIKSITTADIADLLNPLYLKYLSTGEKVYTIIRSVYVFAKKNYGVLEFPLGEYLSELTKQAKNNCIKESGNLPALPFEQIPDFMRAALQLHSPSSLAIVFSILTATRSQAVRFMEWGNIDWKRSIWILKSADDKIKKSGRTRIIYLSTSAIEILRRMPRLSKYVFVSPSNREPLSDGAFIECIKGMHANKLKEDCVGWVDPNMLDDDGKPKRITQHATARSAFSTWSHEDTTNLRAKYALYLEPAIEGCLLHKEKTNLGRSYNRATLEKTKRSLMEDWGCYCFDEINLDDYLPQLKENRIY